MRELYAEKGYNDAKVTTSMTELPQGPKLMQLDFTIDEGPEVQDQGSRLRRQQGLQRRQADGPDEGQQAEELDVVHHRAAGTYQEAKYAEDAEKIRDFYRNGGYVRAQIGQPQVETVETSSDGKTKFIRLRVPVDEGQRYKIGTFAIADNKAIKTECIRSLYKLHEGDYYNEKKLRKGIEKTKEMLRQRRFLAVDAGRRSESARHRSEHGTADRRPIRRRSSTSP